MKVLAFDPATKITGMACLESLNGATRLLDFDRIDLDDSLPLGSRLVKMRRLAIELIEEHSPSNIAIEYVRFNRQSVANFDSLSKVLLITGVIYEASAERGYSPVLLSASQVRGLIGNKEKVSGKKKKVTKSIVEARFKDDILNLRGKLFKSTDLDITDAIALGWVSFSIMEQELTKYGVVSCPVCAAQNVEEKTSPFGKAYRCLSCNKEFSHDEVTPREKNRNPGDL